MEIKVGQKWRTRCGSIVEIVKFDGTELLPFMSSGGNWYDNDGNEYGYKPSKYDLIELVQDDVQPNAESLRARILEIDKERAGLVNQLAELGFTLNGNLDPRDWQKGDVVECVMDSDYFTAGKMYVIERGGDKYGDVIIQEDDDGDECWRYAKNFRFHHRP